MLCRVKQLVSKHIINSSANSTLTAQDQYKKKRKEEIKQEFIELQQNAVGHPDWEKKIGGAKIQFSWSSGQSWGKHVRIFSTSGLPSQ